MVNLKCILEISVLGIILAFIGYVLSWEPFIGFSELGRDYPGISMYLPITYLISSILAVVLIILRLKISFIFRFFRVCQLILSGALASLPIIWLYDFQIYFSGSNLLMGWYLSFVGGVLVLIGSYLLMDVHVDAESKKMLKPKSTGANVKNTRIIRMAIALLFGVGAGFLLLGLQLEWEMLRRFNDMAGHNLSYQHSFSGLDFVIGLTINNRPWFLNYLLLLPLTSALLIFRTIDVVHNFSFIRNLRKHLERICLITLAIGLTILLNFERNFPSNFVGMDVSYEIETGIGWFFCLLGILIAFLGSLISYTISDKN